MKKLITFAVALVIGIGAASAHADTTVTSVSTSNSQDDFIRYVRRQQAKAQKAQYAASGMQDEDKTRLSYEEIVRKYQKRLLHQNHLKYSKLLWGPRIGLNYQFSGESRIEGENNKKYDLSDQFGFNVGAFAKWRIMPHLYLQPELVYTMTGINMKADESTAGMGTDPRAAVTKLHTIGMPLLVGGQFGIMRPYVGVEVPLWENEVVSSRAHGDANNLTVDSPTFKYVVGLGVDIDYQFSVDLRYSSYFGKSTETVQYPSGTLDPLGTQETQFGFLSLVVGMYF